jgi:integrase
MRKQLKVQPYPHSKYSPWMVVVPKTFNGTKRQRFYFKTSEEAQRYCDHLSPANYASLDPHPVTRDGDDSRSLESCAREWLGRFTQAKPMFFQARQMMRPLIARLGRHPIQSVGMHELDALLRSLASKYSLTTQHNYWRRTRQFFAYCHDFGYITKNPMKMLKEPVRREKPKRHILRPEQMAKCLEAAKDDRALTAYLCLGGFAGIRTSEILRMDWDDLFWEEGEIRVRHGKEINTSESKEIWILEDDEEEDISGDRLVTMETAFRRHIEPMALKGEAIDRAEQRHPDGGRGSRKIVPGGQRTLYLLRTKLRDILGVEEWPDNCLRHSFKTYHIAAFRNLERTRFEMGHNHSSTTKYKYGAARLKVVAEQWWAL